MALESRDRQFVTVCYRQSGAPIAEGPRRVSLEVVLGPSQRGCDPDAYWMSLLDSLVCAGALVDDGPHWCETGAVTFTRGNRPAMIVTLEEIDDE